MLAREFLRLTALEALRPSARLPSNGPWPTIAGAYVSDSRIDPFDDLTDDEKRPLIAVFTENSSLAKIAQAGPAFYKGEVDLVFEISVVANFHQDGEVIVDYADTDASIEASLGVLEDQIYHALHFGPTGALFRQMVKLPFEEWHSTIKHRSGEENIRLAARTIRGRIRVKEACYDPAPITPPADFNRLPAALKAIATQLGPSTYLHDLALGMARAASVMPIRVNLDAVAIKTAPQPGVTGTTPVQSAADNLQGG
ncbi:MULTISPECIES: hypothetical protein [unclassified Bradyrhizobium]|uniref:hypothetical protein n=1 Tax=unclassified Bradyrhizobium TaxID=2631580 RepID=UPI0028EEF24C|nr:MULTISPECIES: hypothetical protein [unclassified Bradyrhizobium]